MEEKLGYKIRKIRKIKNFSQAFMAKRLKISQAAYSRLESGRVRMNKAKLMRVASVLKIKTDKIKNFNEQLVFRLGTPAKGTALLVRNENIYNISSLEKMKEVYEKLLKEKDARIKALEEMISNKKSKLRGVTL
jgi:transcriptional regulator with XRE-family HTH domain